MQTELSAQGFEQAGRPEGKTRGVENIVNICWFGLYLRRESRLFQPLIYLSLLYCGRMVSHRIVVLEDRVCGR